MNLKEMYYYVFYKLFKLTEVIKSTFLNEVKAGIMMMTLEIWLVFTLLNYWEFLFHQHNKFIFFSFKILLPILVILVIKWFAFIRDNTWKYYVKQFDSWPTNKNRKGTWIVVALVVFIVGNFFFSHYIRSPSEFRW